MTEPDVRRGNWTQTFQGVQFWAVDPRINEIQIGDIAHSLAMKCRYNGMCDEFYSVAQHSVLVSQRCHPSVALWGLLHDASEAYLVDMPRPLKMLPEFAWYRELEALVQGKVCERFGLPLDEPASVKVADGRWLMSEKRDIMGPPPAPWGEAQGRDLLPYAEQVVPWDWRTAQHRFLQRFFSLAGIAETTRYVEERLADRMRRDQAGLYTKYEQLEEIVRDLGGAVLECKDDMLHFMLPTTQTIQTAVSVKS